MTRILRLALMTAVLATPVTAMAQEQATAHEQGVAPVAARVSFADQLGAASVKAIDARDFERRFATEGRSAVLVSLYATFAGLQVMDIVSTRGALERGGAEMNPLMKEAVGSNSLSLGIKGATTAATILAIDRIGKRNRKAGIAAAVIANGVTAAIVAHNMRVNR